MLATWTQNALCTRMYWAYPLLRQFKLSCHWNNHCHHIYMVVLAILVTHYFRTPYINVHLTPLCNFSFLFRYQAKLLSTKILTDLAHMTVLTNVSHISLYAFPLFSLGCTYNKRYHCQTLLDSLHFNTSQHSCNKVQILW